MLDDVADKARRNLMVMSTGILAVFALGIPLDGKLVGAVDLSAVQPWRAWLVALIALVYFAARYHYAPEQAARWKEWKDRRQQKLQELMENEFVGALQDPMPKSTNKVLLHLPEEPSEPGWRLARKSPSTWEGSKCSFDFKWIKNERDGVRRIRVRSLDGSEPQTTMVKGQAILSASHYRALRWESVRFAYTPSWNLLEISVPWILAIPAAAVCVGHIVVSLCYDWPFVRQLLTT